MVMLASMLRLALTALSIALGLSLIASSASARMVAHCSHVSPSGAPHPSQMPVWTERVCATGLSGTALHSPGCSISPGAHGTRWTMEGMGDQQDIICPSASFHSTYT